MEYNSLLCWFPFAPDRRYYGTVLLHGSELLIYDLSIETCQFCNLTCVQRLSGLLHRFQNDLSVTHHSTLNMTAESLIVLPPVMFGMKIESVFYIVIAIRF